MIQVRLWTDCYNNCSFCSVSNKSITTLEDKKTRINKLSKLNDSKIGIIGGEFFEGQLKGVEDEWLNMVKTIGCNELFITANLINEQYLLKETLEVRPDILICTSYDTVGRFKTEKQKYMWLERVSSLKNVFCTIIPTEDMIHDTFIDKIPCGINLCEPHLGIDWLTIVDKTCYHEILIKENKTFNLPKRNNLLKWLIGHPKTLELMKSYKRNHFDTILSFDADNNFIYESSDRFNDKNFMAECGHPYFSRCYADSDRCLICDIEEM
jgi:hypothetical protein